MTTTNFHCSVIRATNCSPSARPPSHSGWPSWTRHAVTIAVTEFLWPAGFRTCAPPTARRSPHCMENMLCTQAVTDSSSTPAKKARGRRAKPPEPVPPPEPAPPVAVTPAAPPQPRIQSLQNGWHMVEVGTWQVSVGPDKLIHLPRHADPAHIDDMCAAMHAAAELDPAFVTETPPPATGVPPVHDKPLRASIGRRTTKRQPVVTQTPRRPGPDRKALDQ